MTKLLEQLGSPQAVLMMYVAGELPPEDRAEVERMLAADAGLRAALEELSEAQDVFDSAMPALDRSTRLAAPQSAGVRRVVRAIRQWQAGRVARPLPAAAPTTLRYPWWAYPLAAAASVVIAFVVWWGNADRGAPRYFTADVPLRFEPADRPSEADMKAALFLMTMGGPVDEPEEFASLVDPTDYAVMVPLVDEADVGGGGPGAAQPRKQAAPATPEPEEDELLL